MTNTDCVSKVLRKLPTRVSYNRAVPISLNENTLAKKQVWRPVSVSARELRYGRVTIRDEAVNFAICRKNIIISRDEAARLVACISDRYLKLA